MKSIIPSILPLLLATSVAQADTISVTGAANSTTRGTADNGFVQTTTLVADNTPSPQPLAVTVSNLDIDGTGGDNDSVILNFTVTTDGQNIQTSGTTAAGWLSSGGVTLNANGEFVQVDFTSMSVDLNGVAGSGTGSSGENFLGFTGVGFGSWASGHVAVVNGTSQAYVDGTADKHLALPNDPSIKSWFDTAANTGAALDSAGSWRPENFDFQFEVNITPPSATNDILHFQAVPGILRDSGDVTVYWATTGGDSFTLDDGSGPVTVSGSGSQVFTAVSADTTFTFTAVLAGLPDAVATSSVDVRSGADPVSYEETILADGPLAYYRFEEFAGTTQLFDYSPHAEHSIEFIEGLTGLEFGQTGAIGSAARFNGMESIILGLDFDPSDPDGDDTVDDNGSPEDPLDDIPDIDPDGIEGWSLELLVRPDDVTPGGSNQLFVANRDGTGAGRSMLYLLGGNAAPTSYMSGQLNSGVAAFDDSWLHLVMTVSYRPLTSDYTMRMYLNGTLIATFEAIAPPAADGNWVLGSHKNSNSNFLQGLLDEVSFYAYALDDPNGDGDLADSKIPAHFAAYTQDGAALLSFGTSTPLITEGETATLQVIVGDAAQSVTIDNGVGPVTPIDGIATATVSPTAETTYTVTVNDGATDFTATATIAVAGPIQVTSAGFNELDEFQVDVDGLTIGLDYSLFAGATPEELVNSPTIVESYTAVNPADFFLDAYPPDGKQFYRVGLSPNP